MKKKLFTLFLCLSGLSAFAQRNIKFTTTLAAPAEGSTITVGVPFVQQIVIKNEGPDAIVPGDTVFYIDPTTPAGSFYIVTGYAKVKDDTIQLNTTYKISSASPGDINYCVGAGIINRKNPIRFDTTGFSDCNSVTIAGGTGVAELVFQKEEWPTQLKITPNPALSLVRLDFVAQDHTAVNARVTDLSGRVVLQYQFGNSYPGQNDFNLDVSGLGKGIYFVELRQGNYRAIGKLLHQ